MKPFTRLAIPLAIAALAAPALTVQASSHREAPFIAEMPKVDATDFYMFSSYEANRSGYVTLVANYVPLQDSYGGPNYFMLDPEALYEIHVDNNGDAKEDLTFQFRFNNKVKDTQLDIGGKKVSIPLINSGPISVGNTAALNVEESYRISLMRGDRRSGGKPAAIINADSGATSFAKPVDNIGNKSIPDYAAYAKAHTYNVTLPGCDMPGRVFVGQRKDPFVVNLGETFDLINTNPLGPVNGEVDSLADKNVTSLILEVHASCLTNGDPVIGAWTTASVRQGRLLRNMPDNDKPALQGGPWVQVSRLGMPLVNEVVIGLKDKNKFNASKPKDDAQFADYVTHPTLPALIEILFPIAKAPTNFPRNDLVTAFLTGVPGLNQPKNVVPSELLRLNTSTPITAKGAQNNLGVIGGDSAGFPNGRRPGDDVVDIALRVVMGKLCTLNIGCAPADAPVGDAALTDGALVNDTMFTNMFPYLLDPLPGSPN